MNNSRLTTTSTLASRPPGNSPVITTITGFKISAFPSTPGSSGFVAQTNNSAQRILVGQVPVMNTITTSNLLFNPANNNVHVLIPTNSSQIINADQLTRRPLHNNTPTNSPDNGHTVHFGKRPSAIGGDPKICPSCQKMCLDFNNFCAACKKRFISHPTKELVPLGSSVDRHTNETTTNLRFDLNNPLASTSTAINRPRLTNNNNNLPAKVTHVTIPVRHKNPKVSVAAMTGPSPPILNKQIATHQTTTTTVIDLVDDQDEAKKEQPKNDATTAQSSCVSPPENANVNSTSATTSVAETPCDKNGEISIPCRSIRFGSYRTTPYKSGFVIHEGGVQLTMKEDLEDALLYGSQQQPTTPLNYCARKAVALNISWRHVVKFQYVLTPQIQAVFLLVREYCARRIRETFNMANDADDDDRKPHFSPDGDKLYHKYITIVLSSRANDWVPKLMEFVANAEKVHNVEIDVVELPYINGNRLLAATVPPSAKEVFARQLTTNDTNRCSSTDDNKINNVTTTPDGRKRTGDQTAVYCNSVGEVLKRLKSADDSADADSMFGEPSTPANQNGSTPRGSNCSTVVESPVRRIFTASLPTRSTPVRCVSENECLFIFPPADVSSSSGGCITVSRADVKCLDPDEFLNDTIIDFYLKYIELKVLSTEQRSKIHVFNSFFYSKLTKKSPRGGSAAKKLDRHQRAVEHHKRVRTWTKNVDLFEKDFVVIPINENSHWYLAIICYPALTGVEVYSTPTWSPAQQVQEQLPNSQTSTIELLSSATPTSSQNQNFSSADPALESDDDEDDREEAIEEQKQWMSSSANVTNSAATNANCAISRTSYSSQKVPCILVMDSLWTGTSRYKTVSILRDYLTEEFVDKHPDRTPLTFDRNTLKGFYPKVPQQDNYSDCGVFVLHYAETFLSRPPDDFSQASFKNMQDWFSVESIRTKRENIRQLTLQFADEYSRTKKMDDDASSSDLSP